MSERGFGIDATTPIDVARQVAQEAEAAGFRSFWVNGSPPREALEILGAAADVTSIPLGTGVIPLHRRGIDDVIDDVKQIGIPAHRLLLGIGYGEPKDALATMREAVRRIRHDLGAAPIVGPFGPNMTRLAGEISDGALFTWWFREAIEESRPLVE
ncbi:MAG: LLM class flavin-dependent oxidoreductase, partial [Chloroflexota bacterium]